jgi:peptidyl-Lys metalloendopeptidase
MAMQCAMVLFFALSVANKVAAGGHSELPQGISVSLQLVQKNYNNKEAVLVEVSYRNTTNAPIEFLRWSTVLDGRIDHDFLSILYEGEELHYTGRHYKRAAPTPEDYIVLLPGARISATVDLLTGYDINYSGDYQLSVRGGSDQQQKQTPITFKLLEDRAIFFKVTPVVSNCSAARRTLINSALGYAESISRKARDDLQNTPVDRRANAERYLEWFGAYTASRWTAVQNHFNQIYARASNTRLTFICDDTRNVYAYVYPDQPYDIYLGQAFWRADQTGTDSKSGTIVHELSHFTVVANTDDIVYGQEGARLVAINNPNGAIRNADSLEYFAENTPALTMPPPLPPTYPDLFVSSSNLESQAVNVNGTIGGSATVKNGGTGGAAATLLSLRLSNDAQISVADTLLDQRFVPALAVGEHVDFNLNVLAPNEPGNYWVGVCVTVVSGESSISNNCSSAKPLTVNRASVVVPAIMLLLGDDDG